MTSLGLIGALLNSLAAIVMLVPFLFVYSDGKFAPKTKERIEDISATKFGGNKALGELFLARSCAAIAVVLLIFGTIFLIS